ncbi:MAG: response regulator [Candidatus Stygibacter australis]|nr:response regulator [Candidatus Stygibacter australis]MDP8322710.1 response regulator [Candidatus Stygibacter australis]
MSKDKRKLLIVEDEIIIAMRLEIYFRSKGYDVLGYVTTGREAIDKALECHPDLIIMDINLKGDINGLDAAEKIIESQYIPIIFITGYSDEEYKNRAMKLNPLGYFFKPVNLYELLTAINNLDD